MSFGGGYQGGRTRMGTKVTLNIYDLTPANDFLYPIGFGFHHSGVEIMGTEYSYASGAGVFESSPKDAPGAQFRESIELGVFDGGMADVRRVISDLRDDFGPDDYNLIKKNCNSFANALVWALLHRQIPAYVNRLADFGVCCKCFLPRKLLEEAPVGDPNAASRASGGGSAYRSSSSTTTQQIKTFSGSGARLGGPGKSGITSRLLGTNSSSRQDDLTDRREKARLAALNRMEQAAREDAEEKDSDKSR